MKLLLLCVVFVAFTSVSARKKCYNLDELPEKYKKHEKHEPICSAHEHYEECGKPKACEPSCEGTEVICADMCVTGCYCDEGYVRNKEAICVLPKECPALQCGDNENFVVCSTLCGEATCTHGNFFCGVGCSNRCHCNDGFVRDADNKCIKKEDCPAEKPNPQIGCLDPIKSGPCKAAFNRYAYDSASKSCILFSYGGCEPNGNNYETLDECQTSCSSYVEVIKPICKAHETYSECGILASCRKTCDNPDGSMICATICVPGCFCDDGYVLDTSNQICVLVEECPKIKPDPTCETNEEYLKCGPNCDATCADPTGKDCTVNYIRCPDGCYCKSGYARDDKGICVKIEECPAVQPICTKAFEHYTDCGSACPTSCDNVDKNTMCIMMCVQGCFCDAGYIRNAVGDCILPEQCPPKPLDCTVEHEAFFSCSQLCEDLTCEKPDPTYCRRMCLPRCLCEEGFVRNANNQCVKPSDCQITPKPSKSCEKPEGKSKPSRPHQRPQPKKSCSQENHSARSASNSHKRIKAKSEKSGSGKRSGSNSKSNQRAKPRGGKSCSGSRNGSRAGKAKKH